MSTISRRAFLKTVGVGALSVAAVSVLAGCDTVPGTSTGTGAAKPVTGKAGVQYRISDAVAVRTASAANGTVGTTLDVELATTVKTTYENAYKAKAISFASDATAANYKEKLTSEQIAECEAAGEKAVANMDDVELELFFNVFNNTGAPIFLATASDASNTSGCVFTASCNGASINCELDTVVVNGSSMAGMEETVTCTVAAPANAKEVNVVVTAPNATSVVTYTYVNTAYVDLSKIDPSKISSWS